MPYPAAAIANSFLDLAEAHGSQLTPMQIQKLVYFAHGWYLASESDALSEEKAQAWRWGPVFPSLYHNVKQWGGGPVLSDVISIRYVKRDGHLHAERTIPRVTNDEMTTVFVSTIWEVYGAKSGPELSRISHDIEGPWYRVWTESGGAQGAIIPDELIKEYFENKLKVADESG